MSAEEFIKRYFSHSEHRIPDFCENPPLQVLLPPKHNKERDEKIHSEFEALTEREKLQVLGAFSRQNFTSSFKIFQVLLPEEFKEALTGSDSQKEETLITEIHDKIPAWRETKRDTSLVRVQVAARLQALRNLHHSSIDPNPIKVRATETLPSLYEAQIFDTDGDGVVDAEDSFPTLVQYQKDDDQNKIPDELETSGRGPADFFGMKEGEGRSLWQVDVGFSKVDAYRVKDQVYLVVHIRLKPDTEEARIRLPYLRAFWKKNVEENYKAMMPEELKFVKVLVDFTSNEGTSVKIKDTNFRSNSGAWALDLDGNGASHEVGHHLMWKDRYDTSSYFQRCAPFHPLLIELSKPPHLMNKNTLTLNPVDPVTTIDLVSQKGSLIKKETLVRAEIHFLQGDFEKAAGIYKDQFEKLKSPLEQYFKNDGDDDLLNQQISSIAALKGWILSEIRLFENTKDTGKIAAIEDKIGLLEQMGTPQKETSPEAQAALSEAKVLRGFLKKAQGDESAADDFFDEAEDADQFNKGKMAGFLSQRPPKKYYGLDLRAGVTTDIGESVGMEAGITNQLLPWLSFGIKGNSNFTDQASVGGEIGIRIRPSSFVAIQPTFSGGAIDYFGHEIQAGPLAENVLMNGWAGYINPELRLILQPADIFGLYFSTGFKYEFRNGVNTTPEILVSGEDPNEDRAFATLGAGLVFGLFPKEI